MQLSSSIYKLKRQAKLLARSQQIKLHKALDLIAQSEGFQAWSHLAARAADPSPAQRILSDLDPGDMLLIAARPGQGKTRLGIELAALAGTINRSGYVFTLDYNEADVQHHLDTLDPRGVKNGPQVTIDTSDEISADYIAARLRTETNDKLVVIDYLQILDQRRDTPSLDQQVQLLKKEATDRGMIIAMIAQIHRSFELSERDFPNIDDVRLPNSADLSAFNKRCFLNGGALAFDTAG